MCETVEFQQEKIAMALPADVSKGKCDKCHKFTANGGVSCEICKANYHWGCAKAKNILTNEETLTCCISEEDGDDGETSIGDGSALDNIVKTVVKMKRNQVTKKMIRELIREAVQRETAGLRREIADLKNEIRAMPQRKERKESDDNNVKHVNFADK